MLILVAEAENINFRPNPSDKWASDVLSWRNWEYINYMSVKRDKDKGKREKDKI